MAPFFTTEDDGTKNLTLNSLPMVLVRKDLAVDEGGYQSTNTCMSNAKISARQDESDRGQGCRWIIYLISRLYKQFSNILYAHQFKQM